MLINAETGKNIYFGVVLKQDKKKLFKSYLNLENAYKKASCVVVYITKTITRTLPCGSSLSV